MKIVKKIILGSLLFSSLAVASTTSIATQNWQKTVEQAKKEGSITFSVWYLQPHWRLFVKTFEKEYGIKVQIPEGTSAGNMNKLMAESGRKQGKMDVVAVSISQLPILRSANALQNINWLPGYSQAIHQIQNVNTDGYAVAFWGNQTGLAYDPQQIGDKPLPQTLDELQQFIDANPKKFGYNDPNNGGAGEAFIQRVVSISGGEFNAASNNVDEAVIKNWSKGWQWFAKNKDKITQTASGADSLTRLNDGELALVPAWQDHMVGLQRTGAITSRLRFYIPEFGMPGGGNIAIIAANTPHPAASAVFLNWLIQEQTQKAMSQTFGTIPMNQKIAVTRSHNAAKTQFYGKEYSVKLREQFVRHVTIR